MDLIEITGPPTADNAVIQLNAGDNVAIARVSLEPGFEVRVGGVALRLLDSVPAPDRSRVARAYPQCEL